MRFQATAWMVPAERMMRVRVWIGEESKMRKFVAMLAIIGFCGLGVVGCGKTKTAATGTATAKTPAKTGDAATAKTDAEAAPAKTEGSGDAPKTEGEAAPAKTE